MSDTTKRTIKIEVDQNAEAEMKKAKVATGLWPMNVKSIVNGVR